ncbi:hydroxymethylbilane synthase [Sphingobium jiangsuense]|uniref:Hydroxymethylbilane synthase n=2 Tax=Sphingobium jiangsuense TaxID=870476 RepID=A0A7W6FPT7_9SPHN|nr:hydroxymethylbilane synthase [Sphingobium jiangsuense]MBB3926175.1 hydroxymethylbilane synthase [Sphingobium jiangsuense]
MTDTAPPHRPLRLGSRASPLAMAQARLAARALCDAHGWAENRVVIVPVTASGDKVLDRPLADIGGKALWTKELDHWLHDGTIDASVHSMKDVETIRPETLCIAAMLPRADVRDTLVGAASIEALPQSGRLGTSSPRRSAQIRRLRPDIMPVLFRGNVATRLARLEAGEADATLLATAGLARLGQTHVGTPVPVAQMLPAPSQGAIGIEVLAGNATIAALVGAVDHRATSDCVHAERAVLEGLDGSCHSPIAALGTVEQGGHIRLRAEILSPDGTEHIADVRLIDRGDHAAAYALGRELLAAASPSLRALFTP